MAVEVQVIVTVLALVKFVGGLMVIALASGARRANALHVG